MAKSYKKRPRKGEVEVRVLGTRIFDEYIKELDNKQRRTVFQNAAKIALQPVHRRVKLLTPKGEERVLHRVPTVRAIRSRRNTLDKRTGTYGKRVGSYIRSGLKSFNKKSGNLKTLFYGPFVYTGTKYQKEQPILQQAAQQKGKLAQNVYMIAIRKNILKIGSDAGKKLKADIKANRISST